MRRLLAVPDILLLERQFGVIPLPSGYVTTVTSHLGGLSLLPSVGWYKKLSYRRETARQLRMST